MKDNGFNFEECRFINDEMKFYSFKEFVYSCKLIKRMFDTKLSKNGKIFYKWYVYSNVYMNMNEKNKVWDYLNEYLEREKLYELIKKD